MVKILLIIPYQEVEEQILRQLREVSAKDVIIETTHIFGTDHSVIEERDPDIIVARGMTGAALAAQYPNKHMVTISMTSYDILAALADAKERLAPRRVALCVAGLQPEDIASFGTLTGMEVELFAVSNEDGVDQALQEGLAKGVEVFIGGLTICQECRSRGIPNIHIKTSGHALRTAIHEAVATAVTLNQERGKTVLFQSLLNNSPDAILSVDNQGRITALNSNAYKIRRLPATQPLVGKKLDSYWRGIDWRGGQDGSRETLLEAFGSLYFARCLPIIAQGSTVGTLITIQAAHTIQQAETQIRKELSVKGLTAKYRFGDIVGISAAIKNCISVAVKYAQVDANVLLVGETGTGKELFAHSIHMASSRKEGPFVAVNCAALPESLLESELFGYVEGAFSGAVKGGKIGLFELAHKGSIFLDEIGEMPIAIQAKLLRVLQEKEIRRIGDDRVYPVDVRVISATNINIQEQIAAKQFRSDLYYRLNLLNLVLPPLRERREDIAAMADYFLQLSVQLYKRPKPVVTPEALAALEAYHWPGNAREMKNFCEKVMVLNESGYLDLAQLARMGLQVETPSGASAEAAAKPTKEEVIRMMRERKMTNDELAKALGISRTTLWRWSRDNS